MKTEAWVEKQLLSSFSFKEESAAETPPLGRGFLVKSNSKF